jgi:hypothetical protein
MKDYMEDVRQSLSPKNLVGHFGLYAIGMATLALILGLGKLIDLLQNNGFGFWGDALILSLGYIGVTLITWMKLIFYHCLGAAAGYVILAGALAMTYTPVMLVGASLVYIGYYAPQRPFPQQTFRLEFPLIISSRFAPNCHTSSGKFSSLSGGPYPLYSLSCIMLN